MHLWGNPRPYMNDDIRQRLSRVFSEHESSIQAAARRRVSRGEEAERRDAAFRRKFEKHTATVVLPAFETVSAAVHENGHHCTVTRATHGTFFSGPDDAPGVIFMFYPESVPEEDYALKPGSSFVAVFADFSRQQAQLHTKAVRPHGFMPGQLPDLLPLSELTPELLTATCIDIIEKTLHHMEG